MKKYTVDDLTKALGALAICSYVSGYLVLSYYLSSYGFSPVSPFRPRVLEIGVCALVFLALPILIGIAIASLPSRGLSSIHACTLRLFCLPTLCWFTTTIPGFVVDVPKTLAFQPITGSHLSVVLKIMATLIVSAAVIGALHKACHWIWENYHQHKIVSLIGLLTLSAVCVFLENSSDKTQLQRRAFFWLLSCSSATILMAGSLVERNMEKWIDAQLSRARDLNRRIDDLNLSGGQEKVPELILPTSVSFTKHKLELQQMKDDISRISDEYTSHTTIFRVRTFIYTFMPILAFNIVLLALAAYTNWIFPFIPLKLGGGEIVNAIAYERDGGGSNHIIRVGLLDQNDQGFFVIEDGFDKAWFIPKEKIEAIHFGTSSKAFTP